MVEVLTSLGDRLTKSEARKLVANADVTGDGRIDYQGPDITRLNLCVICIIECLLALLLQQKVLLHSILSIKA